MRIAYITSMSGIGGGETGLLNTMQSVVALGHHPVLVCPPGELHRAAMERHLVVHAMELPNVHLRGGVLPCSVVRRPSSDGPRIVEPGQRSYPQIPQISHSRADQRSSRPSPPSPLPLGEGRGERVRSLFISGSFPRFARVVRELRGVVRANRIDVLHAESLLGLIYGGIVARLAGKPCVASYYGYWPLGLSLRLVLRFLCDRVFPIARCVADELAHGIGLAPDRMPIIPNELSPEFFSALPSKTDARKLTGLPTERPIVMQIARFQKIKGQMTLIKAAEILLTPRPSTPASRASSPRPSPHRGEGAGSSLSLERERAGVRVTPNSGSSGSCVLPLFVFVGGVMSQYRDEIEYRDEVMARVRQSPLSDRVLFLGHRTDIPLLLRAADVFVNPSDYETFGMSVLEAAVVGTPIVATNVGGPASLLTDQKTGLLVPPQNPAAMAEAIRSVLQDPVRASGIARQAQIEARRLYAPGTKARRLVAEYEQIGKRQTTKPKRQTQICPLSFVVSLVIGILTSGFGIWGFFR